MTGETKFFIIELDSGRASKLTRGLSASPNIFISHSYSEAVEQSHGLDVILISLMSAMEWGLVKSPPPVHKTSVLAMPASEVARGSPRFGKPRVALEPGESMEAQEQSELVLKESLKALRRFNERNSNRLRKVGAASVSLGLDKLESEQAIAILQDFLETSQPKERFA